MENNNVLLGDYQDLDYGFVTSCRAVACTMGAEGKLALIDTNESFTTTKDGISTLRSIRFAQKTQSWGAMMAIKGAARILEQSGDSTSTGSVLMMNYLLNLDRKDFNKAVERGMNFAMEEVYGHLAKLSKKALKKDLKKIAKVACNNDEKLAKVIVEAFEYAGKNGVVHSIINPNSEKVELIKQDGLLLDAHGYASPHFVNKQDKKIAFEGENVAVILAATWDYSPEIIASIQTFYQDKPRSTPLIVFTERPNADMTEKLVGIKQVGYNICLVATNGYDEFESETLLNDIANFTSAKVYNPRDPGSKIVYGLADKVVSTFENTSLVVHDVPQVFKDTLAQLEKMDKKDVRRIQRLKTKASVISVGGITPGHAKEIDDRVDDAMSSYRTTTKEGYIVGGGAGLVYVSGLMNSKMRTEEEQRGYDLVKTVIQTPFLQILQNSNRNDVSKVGGGKDYLNPVKREYGKGYNAVTDELSNLFDDGIIDSKLSIRIALESSMAVAIQMFNIGVIVHFPETSHL